MSNSLVKITKFYTSVLVTFNKFSFFLYKFRKTPLLFRKDEYNNTCKVKPNEKMEVKIMSRNYKVAGGAVTKYYNTKEEAISETMRLSKLGIGFGNELYKYNETTDRYELIGTFRRS